MRQQCASKRRTTRQKRLCFPREAGSKLSLICRGNARSTEGQMAPSTVRRVTINRGQNALMENVPDKSKLRPRADRAFEIFMMILWALVLGWMFLPALFGW